jgi:hypothetical protein
MFIMSRQVHLVPRPPPPICQQSHILFIVAMPTTKCHSNYLSKMKVVPIYASEKAESQQSFKLDLNRK